MVYCLHCSLPPTSISGSETRILLRRAPKACLGWGVSAQPRVNPA